MSDAQEIHYNERWLGDQPAQVTIVRARVIRWKHAGNACDCDNEIVQIEGSKPRRSCWYLEAKCGRCHQTVRLYTARGRKRYTIDPTYF
jgi:hypothetical protein